MTWFDDLRQQWRPAKVRLLLIGESAPDPSSTPEARRFFYAPTISRYDNLFRGVIEALYDAKVTTGEDRTLWLERLRDDGVYLIDLVPFPVNRLSSGDRRRALSDNVDARVAEAASLEPEGIIICHGPTFKVLRGPLHKVGLSVLHDVPIPFPLGNHRAPFVAGVRKVLSRNGSGA
jgi:hypothetical protein